MNPGLTREEITDTLAALHRLTETYRTLYERQHCPLCSVNYRIMKHRNNHEDQCYYCPHIYLDNIPLKRFRPPCNEHDNYVSVIEIVNFKRDPYPNHVRISRWIHQLVYMLMETPE